MVSALTEDFYPTVLVYKNVFNSAPERSKAFSQSTLVYPNFSNYTYILGDNFAQFAQQSEFNYTFRDFANTTWTYYTIGVYSFSYGLTDLRKHEFELSLFVDSVASANLADQHIEMPKYFNFLGNQDEDGHHTETEH